MHSDKINNVVNLTWIRENMVKVSPPAQSLQAQNSIGSRRNKERATNRATGSALLAACPFYPFIPNDVDPTIEAAETFCCSGCGVRGKDTGVSHCCHMKHVNNGGKIKCRTCRLSTMF